MPSRRKRAAAAEKPSAPSAGAEEVIVMLARKRRELEELEAKRLATERATNAAMEMVVRINVELTTGLVVDMTGSRHATPTGDHAR